MNLSEQVRRLEIMVADYQDAAQKAFVVLEETPEPVWEDERYINNRIQEAHDILDTVLSKHWVERDVQP